MLDPLYAPNPDLNCNISLDETAAVIMNARKHSSCGIDKIPHDVLKYPPIIVVIHKLFQLILTRVLFFRHGDNPLYALF